MHLLLRQFFAEIYAETSIEEVISLTSDSYIVSNSSEVFRCRGHCAVAIICLSLHLRTLAPEIQLKSAPERTSLSGRVASRWQTLAG
jgi:hypothetical protein